MVMYLTQFELEFANNKNICGNIAPNIMLNINIEIKPLTEFQNKKDNIYIKGILANP